MVGKKEIKKIGFIDKNLNSNSKSKDILLKTKTKTKKRPGKD